MSATIKRPKNSRIYTEGVKMALNFGEDSFGFSFEHSTRASQGIQNPKRIETASIVVATDESGDFQDIQEAIDSLDGKGGFIQIKEGTYNISKTITVPSNVTIKGVGFNTLIKVSDDDGFENDDLTTGNDYISITNLRVDASGTGVNAIRLKNCDSCRIDDMWVKSSSGANKGIFLEDSDKIIVNKCTTLDSNYGYGIELDNCDNCIISNNDMFGENVSINLLGSDYNVLVGNQCNDAQDIGINLDSTSDQNTITTNLVRNSGNLGIDISGDNNVINSNQCGSAFTRGIYINSGAASNIITSNQATITDNGTSTTTANNVNL